MPNELNPYNDQDRTFLLVQQTVSLIMEHVNSIDDITNDQKKNAMFQNVLSLLDQLNISILDVFPAEIADAYTAGHTLGGDLLREQGMDNIKGDLKNAVHAQAVQSVATSGYNDLQAALRTAAELFVTNINGTLQTIQDNIGKGLLLGQTTATITKAVQMEFARNGLTSFTTIDGKKLPLDFYAMTVTRTKVRDAQVQGSTNRYVENDIDLVRINERSFTCHVCGARQGMVVSLSGNTEGYPTIDDIGGLPPFHPNCRHYIIPVTNPDEYPPKPFTGRDKRTAASKEHYKNEQAIRRKANEEKKTYMKMKAEADASGQDFPNIGTWRRMRRKNDESWKQLQDNYRNSINLLPET